MILLGIKAFIIMINKELKLKYIKSLKSGGKVPKYLTAWGKLDKQNKLDDWTNHWLYRATDPSARSKIAGGWKPGSRNGHVESDEEYTARRTKEEQDAAKKRTRHIKMAADTAHMVGTLATGAGALGALFMNPATTLGTVLGGIAGEKAVDWGLGKLADMTGSKVRSWKDLTDEYLGWSPTLLMLTNPGTLLGGTVGGKAGPAILKRIPVHLDRDVIGNWTGWINIGNKLIRPNLNTLSANLPTFDIRNIPKELSPRQMSDGRWVIKDPDNPGKSILLDKYLERIGLAKRDLGYDPKVIANEAQRDFTGPLAKIIDDSKILTDLADKIKRGESTTEFARNNGTLIDPSARDVLAGELADATRGKQKRGVALVNTMPTNITTTGQETYGGRGNFGLNSFSVTNHPGAVRAYGAIDYPKLTQHIKESKILTDAEKNKLYGYLKEMKKIDKDPLSKMTENTDVKLKLSPEEDIRYLQLINEVNKLIPGTFEYGGLNRHIIYPGLKDSQIINVTSTSDKFGAAGRNVERELLPLFDFLGHRLMTFNPKYDPSKSRSVKYVHNGYVGNILEAERLVGGYKYKDKFGNWEKEPGWNLTPSILNTLRGLLFKTNGKFYVRGVGPNGVPGATDMVTLQAPNGGIPGFKKGYKIKYYKK